MAYPGYWSYAGTRIADTHAAAAYSVQHGMVVGCKGCRIQPETATYTTPEADDAPWWDPGIPESGRVTGVLGMTLTGVSSSTGTRTMRPTLGGGGRLSVRRLAHREIRAELVLLAQDECALSYGVGWLGRALADPACGSACNGDELEFAACCPVNSADTSVLRSMFDVGIMSGPTELASGRYGCGFYSRQEVLIGVGQPWIYRPITATQTVALASGTLVPAFPAILNIAGCTGVTTCFDSPTCTPPPPPPAPAATLNPCFPTGTLPVREQLVSFLPGTMSGWLESVPVITIETAATPVVDLFVRLFQTDSGGCTSPPDPCAYIGELYVPYIGANSELTVDGRTREALGVCGGDVTAETSPLIYGRGGGPFSWPALQCDTGLCAQIVARDGSATATVTISLATRQDAA